MSAHSSSCSALTSHLTLELGSPSIEDPVLNSPAMMYDPGLLTAMRRLGQSDIYSHVRSVIRICALSNNSFVMNSCQILPRRTLDHWLRFIDERCHKYLQTTNRLFNTGIIFKIYNKKNID